VSGSDAPAGAPSWGLTAVRSALALLPDAEGIAERSVGWVRGHDPQYTELVGLRELRRASRACVRLVLSQVAGLEIDAELSAAPERIGRGRAAQAAPLEAVLRALRIDYRLVWEAMLDLAATNEDLDMLELLTDGAARVWDVIDEVSVGVAAAYREAEAELRRSSEEQARALIGALLRGTAPLESTLRLAATHIGFSSAERFVVCSVRAADRAMISEESLRRALARAGMRSAWYSESDTHLGIVQVGSAGAQQVAAVLAQVPEVRAGISSVADGLGATRGNVWQAEAALRAVPPGQAGTAVIEHELLASIASAAPDLAALLSRHVLGPLSELKSTERERVLRSVAAYISEGGSVAHTASKLHYHRNTIINHLGRFELQTGRSLHRPRDLAEIVLALEAERLGQ
jgi:PucR C-terminal helix-turn-helix domain/GGDEF-like domain